MLGRGGVARGGVRAGVGVEPTWQASREQGSLSAVKTSLDHLPERKRHELARIVEILFAEFDDALKGRSAAPQGRAHSEDHSLRQLRPGRLG